MESMRTNEVWDLETIPKGAKIVGLNGSTKLNVTLKGILKGIKCELWRKVSHKGR